MMHKLAAETILIQARARLESVVVEPIELQPEEAFQIALANRLDIMNGRASLVDSWRLIAFNANSLKANWDFVADGNMTTTRDNMLSLRAPASTVRVGMQFDPPFTRLLERNNYRQSLIDYQGDRRTYIQFMDSVHASLRALLRNLEQLRVNLEIQRRAVAISIRRVDLTQEDLNKPVPPPEPGQPAAQLGPTSALNLLTALSDLRNTQNNFMSVWLNYYASRMRLARDLGIMMLDEEGRWVDVPIPGRVTEGTEELPPPPAIPAEWIQLVENFPARGSASRGSPRQLLVGGTGERGSLLITWNQLTVVQRGLRPQPDLRPRPRRRPLWGTRRRGRGRGRDLSRPDKKSTVRSTGGSSMAIQTDEVQDERDALPDPPPLRRSGIGRQVFRAVLVLIVLAAIVTLGAYGSTRLVDRLGSAKGPSLMTHRVTRGELVVTVTEDGNVESANNVDIKCQVAGGSAILTIVKDGSEVKKGDKLVELEQSALDDQINAQKITYEKARSSMIQAEKDYDVAQISVKEFLEGTYLQQLQDQLAQITIAEENLRTAKNSLAHTQRMFRKGYVSQLELEGQQFSVQRTIGAGLGPHGQGRTREIHQGQDARGSAKQGRNGPGQNGIRESGLHARGSPPQETPGPAGQLRHLRTPGRHGRLRQRAIVDAVRIAAGAADRGRGTGSRAAVDPASPGPGADAGQSGRA